MITFVTGNENKRREVAAILGTDNLGSIKLDLPEIQTMDLEEIVLNKVRAAFKVLHAPVMVEDCSYEIDAMNGFPGPFVKFWEEKGLHDAVIANIEKTGNPKSHAICFVGYKDAGHEFVIKAIIDGKHVARTDGEGWGFDYYFVPDGSDRSYAQMGPAAKSRISHRFQAFTALRERLKQEGIEL